MNDEKGKVYLQIDDFKIDVWKQLLYHRDKWVSPQMDSVIKYCIQREFTCDRKNENSLS